MKSSPIIWLLVYFGLATGLPLGAQTRLTEKQAIDLAMSNHPAMASARLQLAETQARATAAVVWEPTEFFHNIAADPDYGMFGTTAFGVAQALPVRKQSRANKTYFDRKSLQDKAQMALSAQELTFAIRSLFQHIAFIEREADWYRKVDSFYQAVSLIAEKRWISGDIALAEKLSIQDKSAQIRLALESTGHEIEFDRLVLAQFLGIPGFVIPDLSTFQRMSFNLADTAGIANSAASKLSFSGVSLSEASLLQVSAAKAPALSAGLAAQYLPDGRWLPGWQLGIKLPLLGSTIRAQEAAAFIRVDMARADYQQSLLKQRNEMAHLLHEKEKFERLLDYFDQYGKAVATELLRAAQLNYEKGEISYLELAQLTERAVELEIASLEHLYGLNMTIIKLEMLTGKQ
jgi:cobalt-zinc-cadmium resistance protein CzcA